MIFVDTGAWFACTVSSDVNHIAAKRWLDGNTELLATTDYVIDETLTLLKVRGFSSSAFALGEMILGGELAEIVMVGEEDFLRACRLFQRFRDKDWSFTDCTSKVIMERLVITRAFAFDHHFRQFGSIVVVP